MAESSSSKLRRQQSLSQTNIQVEEFREQPRQGAEKRNEVVVESYTDGLLFFVNGKRISLHRLWNG
jgi:hypothetical protein